VHERWEKGCTTVAAKVAGGQRALDGVSRYWACIILCSSSCQEGPVGVGGSAGPVCSGGSLLRRKERNL